MHRAANLETAAQAEVLALGVDLLLGEEVAQADERGRDERKHRVILGERRGSPSYSLRGGNQSTPSRNQMRIEEHVFRCSRASRIIDSLEPAERRKPAIATWEAECLAIASNFR